MAERYARRRVGDRGDGRRLRTVSPTFQLTPFLMRQPSDAVNSFTDRAELGTMEAWVREQRQEDAAGISLIHVFIAAYVRTLAVYPALNRFVAGRYLYARDNIDIVLSSGRSGSADTGDLAATVRFLPTDTIGDVYRRISAQVDDLKADETSGRVERIASTLIKTPRFVLRLGLALLRFADYHGWLREKWTKQSPFHGSAVISDEGAYSLPPISRSINSLGSLPVSLSIGRIYARVELNREGQYAERKYVDYTVSIDGRIADSAYFGAAFKFFRACLADPSVLETPPERVNEDAL